MEILSKMKRLLAIILFTLLMSSEIFAQRVDDNLRYAESVWAMKKKEMILEQMDLTEADKSAFWPVYESYANAIQYLDMEYIRLLNYTLEGDLTEKKSASLCEHILMNDLLLAKTRKQYYKKFKKALTLGQAYKFMQLDNNFRTMIRIQALKESPALVSSQNRLYSRN